MTARYWITGLILASTLMSCSTHQSPFNPSTDPHLIGKNAQMLIQQKGNPDQILSSPGSDTYYVYTQSAPFSSLLPSTPVVETSVPPNGKAIVTTHRP